MNHDARKALPLLGLLAVLVIVPLVPVDVQGGAQPQLETAGAGPGSSTIRTSQTYRFTVTNQTAHVFVELDGSITIEYFITFVVASYSSTIDYIDIGLPTNDYDLSSVRANMTKGVTTHTIPQNRIERGDPQYIAIGVTLNLVGLSARIFAGETATLHLVASNPKMLFVDEVNASKASFNFVPNWFDPASSNYNFANYAVAFFFPPNSTDGSQLVYHDFGGTRGPPTSNGTVNITTTTGWDMRLFYKWTLGSMPQQAHKFGASFPASWVNEGVVQARPLDPAVVLAIWGGLSAFAAIVVIASVLYIYSKQKTKQKMQYYPPVAKKPNPLSGCGCCIFIALVFAVIFFIDDLGTIVFAGSLGLIVTAFVFIAYFIAKGVDKRRVKYEKPQLSIECVGVNKNLTVPEAAIIKNTPLGTVIFLILFGMLRKEVIDIKSVKPLMLEKKVILHPDNLRSMEEKGRKLRDYELDIYESIDARGGLVEAKLKHALVTMIKNTHKKMVGFDLKATVAYHDTLIQKAWAQVKRTQGDIKLDDIAGQFEYMLLDGKFKDRAGETFGDRNIIVPYWYYNPYRLWYLPGRPVSTGVSMGGTFGRPGSTGSLNAVNFANSLATGLEGISSNVATNVSNFFNSIVNAVSPPPPKPSGGTGGGGRSYSGGSCACACACACAGCACACAGGGR